MKSKDRSLTISDITFCYTSQSDETIIILSLKIETWKRKRNK